MVPIALSETAGVCDAVPPVPAPIVRSFSAGQAPADLGGIGSKAIGERMGIEWGHPPALGHGVAEKLGDELRQGQVSFCRQLGESCSPFSAQPHRQSRSRTGDVSSTSSMLCPV
jgi:hypothetical protein